MRDVSRGRRSEGLPDGHTRPRRRRSHLPRQAAGGRGAIEEQSRSNQEQSGAIRSHQELTCQGRLPAPTKARLYASDSRSSTARVCGSSARCWRKLAYAGVPACVCSRRYST